MAGVSGASLSPPLRHIPLRCTVTIVCVQENPTHIRLNGYVLLSGSRTIVDSELEAGTVRPQQDRNYGLNSSFNVLQFIVNSCEIILISINQIVTFLQHLRMYSIYHPVFEILF